VFFTIVILLALLALFSFKNRGLQKLLSTIVLLLNSVVLGFLAYTLLIVPGEINFSEKGIWVVVPFISIVCIVLALKGIQRDDNLVKSADRFR
jgi:peptidoglycan/LPS O-acetylase OafA/YrhL